MRQTKMAAIKGAVYTTASISNKQSLTPEGFLLIQDVPVGRTGMMLYTPGELGDEVEAGEDGSIKAFRDESEVFRLETIASATGKPVTNDHPFDDVTPENWSELAHGVMINVRRGEGAQDDLLLADLLITSAIGIQEVQAGKVEVSLGYTTDYVVDGPGIVHQTNIIINHVALVEKGRCGYRCAISDHKPNGKNKMAKEKSMFAKLKQALRANDEEAVKEMLEDGVGEESASGGEQHIHIHTAEKTMATDELPDLSEHIKQNAAEHAEMSQRIAALEALMSKVVKGEEEEGNPVDEEAEIMDEAPEGLEKEAVKAKDSALLRDSWQSTVAAAEIIAPGIRIPTFDEKAKPSITIKKMCGLRKSALDAAYATTESRGIVQDSFGGKVLNIKDMACDKARILFHSVAAQKSKRNKDSASRNYSQNQNQDDQGFKPMTLEDINKANAAFYGARQA